MSRPEVLFDSIADRLVLEISKAKSSIYVAVAWLSNERLLMRWWQKPNKA